MSAYKLTVNELRKSLDEIAADGGGDALVVGQVGAVGFVYPIEAMGTGKLETLDPGGPYESTRFVEGDGDTVVIRLPQMLPVNFWSRNANQG